MNLTQHSYFNLRGTGDVLSHCLAINASTYLPVDEKLIPTGEFAPCRQLAVRFSGIHRDRIAASCRPRATRARAADTITTSTSRVAVRRWRLRPACFEPSSQRTLELRTTEPGVQLYSGQSVGHRGFCLEPQHFPDSPNRPEFPSTLLRPGERYQSTTVYAFGW